MVRIDSVNPVASGRADAELELAEYLERVAGAWGLKTRRLAVAGRCHNLLVTVDPGNDRPWVLFDSHMDTVSVENMTIDPFGGVIEGDRLFGRGACDTKGTGAAMLWALRMYAERGERPNNVALLFSIDEEATMTGIRAFVNEQLPGLGFRPVAAIVGEPTWLRPVIAHNGIMRIRVETHGLAAHSAAPEMGRSAIDMMVKVINALQERYMPRARRLHDVTGWGACSITTIHGGGQVNIIPPYCEINMDRRLTPDESMEGEVAALEAVLEELRAGDRHLDVRMEVVHQVPMFPPEMSRLLLPIVEKVLAGHWLKDPPIGAPFGTHAGDLAKSGIPCVVLGPGDPTPAHTKDEWVSLDAIEQGVKVYADLMGAKWRN